MHGISVIALHGDALGAVRGHGTFEKAMSLHNASFDGFPLQEFAMATRQRSRTPRTPPPMISSEHLSGTPGSAEASQSATDRAVLRSSATTGSDEPGSSDSDTVAPKATFVGEQIIYKDRDARIAEAAYRRAQQRGFAHGCELDDWLAAEQEVDAPLSPAGNQHVR